MVTTLGSLDWSLVQSFLAVAETGSLSGAARRLGASQPTIGRHVAQIEAALDASLFVRQPRGMALSETGRSMMAPAQAMRDAAEALRLTAVGGASDMSGTVRITASLFVAHHILPAIISDLRQLHREIQIEVVASDASENLLFREADIAVRMYRPRQLDMVTRHVGDAELGMFGATTYLEKRGWPATPEDFLSHDFVGYDRNEEIIRGFRDVGLEVDRSFFGVRCDNQTAYWELVRAGCGLGFSQVKVNLADAAVRHVPLAFRIPSLPVWLTAHEAVRRSPRVTAVWEMLGDRLAAACDLPSGGA